MLEPADWIPERLSSSATELAWAVHQIPPARHYRSPPRGLGDWHAARHIFHMGYYEQTIALPSLRQWLGGALPIVEDEDEDRAWSGSERVDELLDRFQAVRSEQIVLLAQLDPPDWGRACDCVWGQVTLAWVVTKTYQHTLEHTNNLLRMALFWDVFEARD
jgi:hypothetical protein